MRKAQNPAIKFPKTTKPGGLMRRHRYVNSVKTAIYLIQKAIKLWLMLWIGFGKTFDHSLVHRTHDRPDHTVIETSGPVRRRDWAIVHVVLL